MGHWVIVIAFGLVVTFPLPVLATDFFRITVETANVRREPSYTAAVITTVKRDTRLPVVRLLGQWVNVEVVDDSGSKTTGFVLNSLGILERVVEVPAPTAPSSAPPSEPRTEPKVTEPPAAPATPVGPVMPQSHQALGNPDSEKADWDSRLERAQNSRKVGKRYVLYGLGASAGGVLIAMATANDFRAGGGSGVMVGALTSTGGGVLAVYGIFKWFSANGDIDDLDREGCLKGYLTLQPTRQGILAQATLSF